MPTDKIILGIDPGTTIMGYGLIHIKGKNMELLQMGVLHLAKLSSHELKLKRIFEKINGKKTIPPESLAAGGIKKKPILTRVSRLSQEKIPVFGFFFL